MTGKETPAARPPESVDGPRRRLLLVSHGPPTGAGGGSARWRFFVRHLPELGWEVDVVSTVAKRSSDPFLKAGGGQNVERRARTMSRLRAITHPIWRALRIRPLPLSTLWIPRGAREVRARLRTGHYDVVLATGPQMAALPAARLGLSGSATPLVVEFRDLWAGSPAYDGGGPILPAVERWILSRAAAIVVVTPEAAAEVRARHPALVACVQELPNGFEPELLQRPYRQSGGSRPLTIIHSGTLIPHRPLAPLLAILREEPYRSSFRLVVHGYVSPESAAEVDAAGGDVAVEVVPSSTWPDAMARVGAADVGMITQAAAAGDATAVAAKVYEYLALGKPVLCITDGGATEGLLRRLGTADHCARLGDPDSIRRALDRLAAMEPHAPLPSEALVPYSRATVARRLAALLEDCASRPAPAGVAERVARSRVRWFWQRDPRGTA